MLFLRFPALQTFISSLHVSRIAFTSKSFMRTIFETQSIPKHVFQRRKNTRLPTTTISPSPSPLLPKPPKHIRRSSNTVLSLPVPKTQTRGIHVSNILVAGLHAFLCLLSSKKKRGTASVTGFADKFFQSYTRHVDASYVTAPKTYRSWRWSIWCYKEIQAFAKRSTACVALSMWYR
jgi:hypothetical protein